MAEPPASRDRLPAWPVGCGLAVLSLLLMFNLLGLVGVLAAGAGLPDWLVVAVPLLAVAPVPLAELAGAIWLRRRNPYAARVLVWCLVISVVMLGLVYLVTVWIDRASGL